MPQRRQTGPAEAPTVQPRTEPRSLRSRRLPLDVDVGPERVIVRAALIGFTAEEIEVRASDRAVTIQTRRFEPAPSPERVRSELYHGNWSRRVRLPVAIRPAGARVSLDQAELRIELPRQVAPEQSLSKLPGGQTLDQIEIPLRSSADVMPLGPGPHTNVYKP